MAEAARHRATYEDILGLPEHVTGEIVNGELYTQPRPAGPHISVGSELGGELFSRFRRGRGGPGGWVILHEPELHLGDEILAPDLTGWKEERLPVEERKNAFFAVVPDWVCEIASPSTWLRDREVKAPAYARQGVEHLWLVDPLKGSVEAFSRQDTKWVWLGTGSDDAEALIPPFEAAAIDLTLVWKSAGVERGG